MNNRDTITRPNQSDRSHPEYGNTKLGRGDAPTRLEFFGGFALLAVIVIAAVLAIAAIGGA